MTFGQIVKPAMVVSVCLILFARPIATFVCLAPFRVPLREMGFISWVGLRGAVPIYLTLIPVLAGLPRGLSVVQPGFCGGGDIPGHPGLDRGAGGAGFRV